MNLVHDGTIKVAEEEKKDRISNLPDDIIHRVLGFLDMKYAVQTSALSKRWKFTWTSMPDLNLDFQTFGGMRQFAIFVKHVLSHRNICSQVSSVNFTFRGVPTQSVVKSILDYAYSHDIMQLTMIWFPNRTREFTLSVFRSHTLRHLTIRTDNEGLTYDLPMVPESEWDFPALETLHLSYLKFGGNSNTDNDLDLFSRCVNLKDLTLHKCDMFHVKIFNICAPQLRNLAITDPLTFPNVFNLVAPQLENLTATVQSVYKDDYMPLPTKGFESLEKVNLLFPLRKNYFCKKNIPKLLDLFRKLCHAKFLIINVGIIQVLSLYLDQDVHEPCPFNNLRCLKIDMSHSLHDLVKDSIRKMVPKVRNYFLENSPSATVIDLTRVSLVDNYPTTNKVANLAPWR